MSRPEKRKTPGKKMMTTTYKTGGKVKKATGGRVLVLVLVFVFHVSTIIQNRSMTQ